MRTPLSTTNVVVVPPADTQQSVRWRIWMGIRMGSPPARIEDLLAHADWLRRLAPHVLHGPDRARRSTTWGRSSSAASRGRDRLIAVHGTAALASPDPRRLR